jgi:hypothetical protein
VAGRLNEHGEAGQAAVETAIVLPLMLFMLLGVLQMSIAYHARLLNEYAAFKVARSASVYRLSCQHMVRAGLMALVPSISRTGKGTPRQRFTSAASQVLGNNIPPGAGVGIPLVQVDYRVSGFVPNRPFDQQLELGQTPLKVHIRLAYFYEYRIPFANWIISRVWLSSHSGRPWTRGGDPITPVRRTPDEVREAAEPSPDWEIAQRAVDRGYYTVPVVSTWSMRMMSDPLPGQELWGQCK